MFTGLLYLIHPRGWDHGDVYPDWMLASKPTVEWSRRNAYLALSQLLRGVI